MTKVKTHLHLVNKKPDRRQFGLTLSHKDLDALRDQQNQRNKAEEKLDLKTQANTSDDKNNV